MKTKLNKKYESGQEIIMTKAPEENAEEQENDEQEVIKVKKENG